MFEDPTLLAMKRAKNIFNGKLGKKQSLIRSLNFQLEELKKLRKTLKVKNGFANQTINELRNGSRR